MTYDEFKQYILTHLWKMGDSVVLDNLPTIMATAEAELNRTLKVESRTRLVDITAEATLWPLPADYRELRHCSSPHRGDMSYLIPADFADQKARGSLRPTHFTVVNKNLRLLGNISPSNPLDLELLYYANLPKYAELEEGEDNWVTDEFLDVYLYCVLKHTAPFLREDERLSTWGALFSDAMAGALDENMDRKYAGSPLRIKMKGLR